MLIFLFCVTNISATTHGTKQASETIKIQLNEPLDSLYGIPRVPDSFHVITMADDETDLAYSNRSTTYPFNVGVDTVKHYGDTIYYFEDQIQDIDGVGGNFLLSITCAFWYDDIPTYTFATVQVISDSLNEFSKFNNTADSVLLANTTELALGNAVATWLNTTRTLTGTQTFDNTGTWTGNLTGSVGSLTTNNDKTGYALTNIQLGLIADSVWSLDTTDASALGATKIGILMDAKISDAGGTASISDADMAAIADTVWTKAVRALTDKIGFALTDAQLGFIADSVWTLASRTLTVADWVTSADSILIKNRAEIAKQFSDSVLDAVNTGTEHNVVNSLGRQIRELFDVGVTETGTAQDGGTNWIQLSTSASSVDRTYDPSMITLTGSTGEKQTRIILEYVGATRRATVHRNWGVIPNGTTEYAILPYAELGVLNEGEAQAGSNSTITLNTLASADDDAYNGQLVQLVSNTGDDQVKEILDYNGTTKIANIRGSWTTNPTDSTGYVVWPFASTPDTSDIKTMMLNIAVSDTVTNTAWSQLLRQVNSTVFEMDTLLMFLGYNSTNSRSTNGLDSEVDTLHIWEGATEVRRLLFYHIGGAAGDAPDSTKVGL